MSAKAPLIENPNRCARVEGILELLGVKDDESSQGLQLRNAKDVGINFSLDAVLR